jgi:hypothetical protein
MTVDMEVRMTYAYTDCFGGPLVTVPEVLVFIAAITFLLMRLSRHNQPVLGVMRRAWYR